MSKIYVNQTALRIQISLNVSIQGANSLIIKCRKPDGSVVSWTATPTGVNNIYYDVVEGDLNIEGQYSFWPYIVFGNNTLAPGTPSSVTIYAEGT